ncbi:MAG TPA: hypothetical protein VFF54_04790 [Thermodesulfobacteriota bacterium]|nr:hypothetical protein [Thermodesulfobacteriota bacterium]
MYIALFSISMIIGFLVFFGIADAFVDKLPPNVLKPISAISAVVFAIAVVLYLSDEERHVEFLFLGFIGAISYSLIFARKWREKRKPGNQA